MRVILVSVGSDGDILPFVGLGARLRARGHQVTLATNEGFHRVASEHEFEFCSLFSKAETDELFANPKLWHPLQSARVSSAWGCRFLRRQYDLLGSLAQEKETVFIANPAVFAARLLQEKLSKRLASMVIGPWFIPSACEPPLVRGLLNPSGRTPLPIRKLYWNLLHAVGDHLVARHLDPVRSELGLAPIRRIFQWWFSPDLVIGLFPDWYAPWQPDWPSKTRLAGFSMFDGGDGLSSEVLEFCRHGTPVIAITFGTEMWHAAEVFRATLEACQKLGVRALLLTRHPHQLPSPLPSFGRHCDFAPFQHLFPHCAAVVHHGGMGTTARALAAGVPQLILPFAFDQLDNAARVKRLGVGNWLNGKQRTGTPIAAALGQLMTPETRTQCGAVAARFGKTDSLEIAAAWVEEFAHGASTSAVT